MSDDTPSWSSATVDAITAHVCWHSCLDQDRQTRLCESKVKPDQIKMLMIKAVLIPARAVGLRRWKKRKKTKTKFKLWKRVQTQKHQISVHSQLYRGQKLTLKVRVAAQRRQSRVSQSWVCIPPGSRPWMEWRWWEGSRGQRLVLDEFYPSVVYISWATRWCSGMPLAWATAVLFSFRRLTRYIS